VGFQPFVKAGFGQLIREASGTYSGTVSTPVTLGSLTGILGGGLRIFLGRQISLKSEVTSYLQDGSISTWANNFIIHFGGSIYF
jgi:LytS/YehU family sensor histidine kinase